MNELTNDFVLMLKKQFKDGYLDIVVSESDETDYLLSSDKNRELLEKSLKEVNDGVYIRKSLKELDL